MADFVQTMKDWKRMCDTYDYCSDCPLNDDRETCIHASRGKWPNSVDNLERRVMDWAAAHPEPVYPTWGDWFEERGDLIKLWRNISVCSEYGPGVIGFLYKPIPADVAEALKIPPKEG